MQLPKIPGKLPLRLPKLKVYLSEYQRMKVNPAKVQEKVLKKILQDNKNTEYGKKHHFSRITCYKDFAKNVPLIDYENIRPLVERMANGEHNILVKNKVEFFATTSGTTSKPKLIPVTKERTRQLRKEATLWLYHTLRTNPKALRSKLLYFAGPYTEGFTQGGIMKGSISGFLATKTPLFARNRLAIPPEVYNEFNFEKKMKTIALHALKQDISQIGFATPIEGVKFFEYIQSNRNELLVELVKEKPLKTKKLALLKEFTPETIWPHLAQINTLLGPAQQPYIELLRSHFHKEIRICDPGIYASEGRFSLGITKESATSIPLLQENFYEFAKGKKIFLAHELKEGETYTIIITTKEGLYRYNTGDQVTVIGFNEQLPIIKFSARKNFLNIVGELAPENILIEAGKQLQSPWFCFIPDTNDKKNLPFYELITTDTITQKKADLLEAYLKKNIQDYKQMREEFGRLGPLQLSQVSQESVDAFEATRRGQPKPLRIGPESLREKLVIVKRLRAKDL